MKLIDISHTLNEDTPAYPGDYKTSLIMQKTIEQDCFNSYSLHSCLHTGTHIDIPMHLLPDDKTVADFPVELFIGSGVLLDVRGERPITMKPHYNETVTEGSIVLLFTGFDTHYFEGSYFTSYPAVDEKLVAFLLSRKIKMLGMDMPAPDYPPFTFHKALLSSGIFVLENLANLQCLLGISAFEVIAFPLKIAAEASFVRAVCRVT